MKFRLAILVPLVACHFQALPAIANEAATIAEIKSAVAKLDNAYSNEDVATIKRMTVPNHVAVSPLYDRPVSVDTQINAFDQLERVLFDRSPIQVALLSPEIALVTFEKSYKGTYKGKPLPARVFASEIWRKQGDKWLQQLYQETPIRQP